jgi:lipopolysaccharide transport system permease protein
VYLYDYRELIKNLVISDLKVKYASSILGFAWSLLNPLMMMVILYFVFSNVFANSGEQFILYILIGILTWRFFSLGTTAALNSVVGKPSLVTKIYIPREILTLSAVLSCLISSMLEFAVLLPLLVLLGVGLKASALFFPVLIVLYFFIIYGISLALASLYVYFRDLNNIWDLVIQLGFFLSPIVYPISKIPAGYLGPYMLNPVTAIMCMMRGIFIDGVLPGPENLAVPVLFAVLLMAGGSLTFKSLSRRFAEEV